ncbi:MAG: hypothetical protein BWY66_01165 [bacterium ADurb.Bin374]|nr:MAG: hypothetical protein BWY66_01165 [bacterium ADurb.Bin374]
MGSPVGFLPFLVVLADDVADGREDHPGEREHCDDLADDRDAEHADESCRAEGDVDVVLDHRIRPVASALTILGTDELPSRESQSQHGKADSTGSGGALHVGNRAPAPWIMARGFLHPAKIRLEPFAGDLRVVPARGRRHELEELECLVLAHGLVEFVRPGEEALEHVRATKRGVDFAEKADGQGGFLDEASDIARQVLRRARQAGDGLHRRVEAEDVLLSGVHHHIGTRNRGQPVAPSLGLTLFLRRAAQFQHVLEVFVGAHDVIDVRDAVHILGVHRGRRQLLGLENRDDHRLDHQPERKKQDPWTCPAWNSQHVIPPRDNRIRRSLILRMNAAKVLPRENLYRLGQAAL